PVTPRFINHEKYTLVIVDEYSRYTWVYFLKNKSQAPETIMSFFKRVENQNDIKVKQLRTDNVDQNDHNDQNDPSVQNDDKSKHSHHSNDEQIIDDLPNTEDIQISKHLSFPNEDTSVPNIVSQISSEIPIPILSIASLAPQDRWSKDKHIELVNIVGDPRAGLLTRAMAAKLSVASAHECLFVDFLSEEEPKKVSDALKHPGWVDSM
nr:retrovirus-related Pol polyprotein from transposon TNT 1-94 [Tanacetum cinerariifolium]